MAWPVSGEHRGLVERLAAAGALIALEWIGISWLFNPALGGDRLAWFAVPFCSVFLALGYTRLRESMPLVSEELETSPFGWTFAVAHLAALVAFLVCYTVIVGREHPSGVLLAVLYASASLSIVFAMLAFVPARVGAVLLRRSGSVSLYAGIGGVIAWRLVFFLMDKWRVNRPAAITATFERFTLQCVRASLGMFVQGVSADPRRLVVATPHFSVNIGGACSGIEGLGLMLVFTTMWLWFFRKESRFPEALVLIPAALVLSWVANVGRLTALMLIGHLGARSIAAGGFHSLAGWISFNAVAVAFVFTAGRVPWVSKAPRAQHAVAGANPTAAYLTPFVAILAASLLSRAVTADFEWLYPLRFVAAAAALWALRARYRDVDWRFGWSSVGAGLAAFIVWMLSDVLMGGGNDARIASQLAVTPAGARIGWLVFRIAAAVITVPIAEELAFRGYLARRLVASNFESVSFLTLPILPVIVSSAIFGVMHGNQWVAATIVGVMYAAVLRRTGRLGDAVAAHATTNALLAIWVITRGAWHLW